MYNLLLDIDFSKVNECIGQCGLSDEEYMYSKLLSNITSTLLFIVIVVAVFNLCKSLKHKGLSEELIGILFDSFMFILIISVTSSLIDFFLFRFVLE